MRPKSDEHSIEFKRPNTIKFNRKDNGNFYCDFNFINEDSAYKAFMDYKNEGFEEKQKKGGRKK